MLIREGPRPACWRTWNATCWSRSASLGDRRADALMTHRSQVVWLDPDLPLSKKPGPDGDHPASRYPVARETLQNVAGVLRSSEAAVSRRLEPGHRLGRRGSAPVVLPERAGLACWERFRRARAAAMAFVIDEYGVIQGVVTATMEAVVGDIAEAPGDEPRSAPRRTGPGCSTA